MSSIRTLLAVFVPWCAVATAAAQELSPRTYWPAPTGTRVATVGFAYSTGDVATDPSLPVFGVDSRISTALAGYLHTLSLWGRTSNLIIELPYTVGTTTGIVTGVPMRRDFDGVGDIGVTLSVNLMGARSLTPADFQELRRKPRPILGASVKLLLPTGAYDLDKLINVGARRLAAKAELGCIIPIKPRLLFEAEVGAWIFSDNDAFLGMTRQQDPILAVEIHMIKRFKPGFWASLEANFFRGGRSTVGGDIREDLQRNARIGGTIGVPLRGRSAIRFGYSRGVVTKSGGDYQAILVSYQWLLR